MSPSVTVSTRQLWQLEGPSRTDYNANASKRLSKEVSGRKDASQFRLLKTKLGGGANAVLVKCGISRVDVSSLPWG